MAFRGQLKDVLKLLSVSILVFLLLGAMLALVVFPILFPHKNPPEENAVIKNFQAHRAAFERLRDMLQQDKRLVRLASWGVETSTALASSERPTADFPADRYNQYVALLKETGAIGAHRDRSDPPGHVCISIYASGWAGDTRHMDVCWETQPPERQVASLDDFYKTPKPRKPVFRHIDANWYLWADW